MKVLFVKTKVRTVLTVFKISLSTCSLIQTFNDDSKVVNRNRPV